MIYMCTCAHTQLLDLSGCFLVDVKKPTIYQPQHTLYAHFHGDFSLQLLANRKEIPFICAILV